MSRHFFAHPILNSPYERPARHWELDENGQPTGNTINSRRPADFITPIPKSKKQKSSEKQAQLGLGAGAAGQEYDPKSIINEIRAEVERWRPLQRQEDWQVTPETARLLAYWRHHEFESIRPFFCQVEAVETAVWLSEVAPKSAQGKRYLD